MRTTAVVAVLVFAGAGAGQKVPDVRLDEGAPGALTSLSPQIALSGPYAHVTWFDTQPRRELFVNSSRDRGSTWLSSPTRLGTGRTWSPQIAALGSSVYVTWLDDRIAGPGTDIFVNYSTDGGATWLADDVRLNTDPGASATSTHPQIAVAGSSIYVTWFDLRHGTGRSADIYVNSSSDGGVTWRRDDQRLNTNPLGSSWAAVPQVAAAGSSVYVTWQDNRQAVFVPDIYVNVSADRGATWLDEDVRLNTDPAGSAKSSSPQIAAVGSQVYVVWQDERNGAADIYVNCSSNGGRTWLANDIRLDSDPPGAAASVSPQIAVSGTSVYVTWGDLRRGTSDVYVNYSSDGGATWRGDFRVDSGWTTSGRPQIAASGSSVFVTWEDWRNSRDSDVYFNRSTDGGATWLSRDVRLDTAPTGPGNAGVAQIAASGAFVGVTWQDHRNRNSDIYFNIPFGMQPYGPATLGSGRIAPSLSSNGLATIGGSPSLDVTGGLGGATGALLLGTSKTTLELLGGTLLVAPTLSMPIGLGGATGVPGAGAVSLPLPIPGTEAILGVNINFQVLFLDAGAARGLSMTNGVEMWIG